MAWRKGGQRPGDFVSGTGEEVLKKFLQQVDEMRAIENGQPVQTAAGQEK
jgi:hypothetical protein